MNNKPTQSLWCPLRAALSLSVVTLCLVSLAWMLQRDRADRWQESALSSQQEVAAYRAALQAEQKKTVLAQDELARETQVAVERDRVAEAQAILAQADRNAATAEMRAQQVRMAQVQAQMAEAQRRAALQAIAAQKHMIRTEGR